MNSHLLKLIDHSFHHGVELIVSLASPTTSSLLFKSVVFDSACFLNQQSYPYIDRLISFRASSLWFYWLRQKRGVQFCTVFQLFGFRLCICFFLLNSHIITLFDLCFDHGVELRVFMKTPTTSSRNFFHFLFFASVCFSKWMVIRLHCSTCVSIMATSYWIQWLRQRRLLLFIFNFFAYVGFLNE